MGFFGRTSKQLTSIPEPYLRGLRDYGEHLVGARDGYNADLMADLSVMRFAQSDPETYIETLSAAIFSGPPHLSGYAGPCCLGAAEIIVNAFGIEPAATPAWHRIVDTAAAYLRSCGVSYGQVKPYMQARWPQADPGS